MLSLNKLDGLSLEDYTKLVQSGMFWEWFPAATGNYKEDMKLAKEYEVKESYK